MRSCINVYLFMINMWMSIHFFYELQLKATYDGSRNSVQIMHLSHLAPKRWRLLHVYEQTPPMYLSGKRWYMWLPKVWNGEFSFFRLENSKQSWFSGLVGIFEIQKRFKWPESIKRVFSPNGLTLKHFCTFAAPKSARLLKNLVSPF